MKFIELTNANTGDPVLINAEEIRLVAPQFTGTRIVLGDGKNSLCDVSECYSDIINELRRINDLQFCFIESENKNPNMYFGEEEEPEEPEPYLEQWISSVTAEYTGGGINIYYGKTKDGTFFRAVDTDYYYVRFLDTDPSKAGEEADFEYWLKDHTIEEFCDTEETFEWFILMYIRLGKDYCVDPKSKISELVEYREYLENHRN